MAKRNHAQLLLLSTATLLVLFNEFYNAIDIKR